MTTPGLSPFNARSGALYGAMGLPLAFVALPLYVLLPNHYAKSFGMPLATLGVMLLLARLFDALIDPLLGRWVDRLYARSVSAVLAMAGGAAALLALGFGALFFPPAAWQTPTALIVWASGALLVTYVGYSALSVAHQAWAARLGGTDAQRSTVVAWREGFGLVGVVLASIVPVVAGFIHSVAIFSIAIVVAWFLWRRAVRPVASPEASASPPAPLLAPFANPHFLPIFVVFVFNGIASAVPATLLLFFIQDRLQAAAGVEGPLLAAYFVCAALSLPVWLRVVARFGLERAWGIGMALAIVIFVWAAFLGAGDVWAFAVVCALSGVALGADLAVPSALLARVIAQDTRHQVPTEGIYYGWWNFAAKLNLALAAGLALPLLGVWGYEPGSRDPQALVALTVAYCLLPCVLKAAAGFCLWRVVRATPKRV